MSNKQKVALVLSGGGARGIAHIGVIEELEKRNYEITSVAGTSMGSVIGGIYALGKINEFKDWLYSLDRRKVFSLVDFTISSRGFIKGDKAFKEMKKFIPDSDIRDLRIPYVAVAADLLGHEEIVYTEGSLYDAIRASVSIPTVFTPVEKDDTLIVDGGVLNNIPIDHVSRTKGDTLFAVNVNAMTEQKKLPISKQEKEEMKARYEQKTEDFYKRLQRGLFKRKKKKDLSYFNLISKTIDLMTWRIDQLMLEKNAPDLLIEIPKSSAAIFDFYKAEELVETGRHAASLKLDTYEE